MESLIAYLGGKKRLAKEIIKRIPAHKLYVEVFCGSAAIFFQKTPSKTEVINDINEDVFNLYRVVQNHAPEFLRLASDTPLSRIEHLRHKQGFYMNDTEINRAIIFYRSIRSSYASRVDGHFAFSLDRKCRVRNDITIKRVEAAKKRLAGAYIENPPYAKLISKYDKDCTFFYLDPPYWGSENEYGKGIFERGDFQKIVDILKNIKGKFLLSLNDVPEVRELFKDFIIEPISVRYSVDALRNEKGLELLIRNYEI